MEVFKQVDVGFYDDDCIILFYCIVHCFGAPHLRGEKQSTNLINKYISVYRQNCPLTAMNGKGA